MSYKFNCISCGKENITKYLKIGETARCKNCGAEVIVPKDSILIDHHKTDLLNDLPFKPGTLEKEKKTTDQNEFKYNCRISLEHSKLLSNLGYIFIFIGVILAISCIFLPLFFGIIVCIIGIGISVFTMISGFLLRVSSQVVLCFVSIENNTRSTNELVKRHGAKMEANKNQ